MQLRFAACSANILLRAGDTVEAVLEAGNAAVAFHLTRMRACKESLPEILHLTDMFDEEHRSFVRAIKASRESMLLSRTFHVEGPVWRTRHTPWCLRVAHTVHDPGYDGGPPDAAARLMLTCRQRKCESVR
jgi:hypothetical protein